MPPDLQTAQILRGGVGADLRGLNSAIEAMRSYAPWMLVLVRAVIAGEACLMIPERGELLPPIERARRPVIVAVSDMTGVNTWREAQRLLWWAGRCAVLVGDDLDRDFSLTVDAARRAGRALVVSTTDEHSAGWREAIQRVRIERDDFHQRMSAFRG